MNRSVSDEQDLALNPFQKSNGILIILLYIALLALIPLMAVLVFRGWVQITDFTAIKLPNTLFYLEKGNLLPARELSDDGRMFGAPFNVYILWGLFAKFHTPLNFVLILNFISWFLALIAIYRSCLLLGCSRQASLWAAAIFALTPTMVFQATSDNDDLISSITGIIGFYYAIKWWKHSTWQDAVLMGLALGISSGAKLFPLLFVLGLIAWLTFLAISKKKVFPFDSHTRLLQFSFSMVLLLILTLPYFIAPNLGSNKIQLITGLVSNGQNSPFRLSILLQNLIIYNLQAFVSPLLDAIAPVASHFRTISVDWLNPFFVNTFIPKVENYFAYAPGINIFNYDIYDNTTWYGLFPIICLLGFLQFRKGIPGIQKNCFLLILILFLGWNISFCGRMKYIEGLGRYWILPMAILTPLAAAFYSGHENSRRKFVKFLILIVVLGSTISSLVLAETGIVRNRFRTNVGDAWTGYGETRALKPGLKSVLTNCRNVNFYQRIWGFPIGIVMDQFRGDRFTYLKTLRKDSYNAVVAPEYPLAKEWMDKKYVSIPLPSGLNNDFHMISIDEYGYSVYGLNSSQSPCSGQIESPTNNALIEFVTLTDENGKSLAADVSLSPSPTTDQLEFKFESVVDGENTEKTTITDWNDKKEWKIKLPIDAEAKLLVSWRLKNNRSKTYAKLVKVSS
jgi:hypothetical protein